MDIRSLIEQIETGHRRVASAIAALPDDALDEPASEDWTRKDVISHLAFWNRHSTAVIDALTSGREPYDADEAALTIDEVNARVLADHRGDSPATTRQAEADSYAALIARLEATDPADLFESDRFPWADGRPLVETIRDDTDRHYEEHLPQLRR
jgi:hypothetical protein